MIFAHRPRRRLLVLAVSGVAVSGQALRADPAQPAHQGHAASVSSTGATTSPPLVVSRSQAAETYYARRFGIQQMRVHYTASGEQLEFRYRVLDPDKALMLSDKAVRPYLVDEKTGLRLEVPVVEQIGPLRQMTTLEPGRDYWMLFSNPGKVVKPGARVDVNVGPVHVHGLTVE